MNPKETLRAAMHRPLARMPIVKGPLPPAIDADSTALDAPVNLGSVGLSGFDGAANDDALLDFASGPPPLLTLDDKGGLPISPERFYQDVAADALEILGSLARYRFEGPWSRKADEERRILGLVDAILATGEGSPAFLGAEWKQAASSPDPWKTWASAFALASVLGEEALSAIMGGLSAIPPDSLAHVALAAEAIAQVSRPDAAALEERLGASEHPVCRAVVLDLRARRGLVDAKKIAAALAAPEPALVDTALRLLDRAPESYEAVREQVNTLLAHPSRVIAWRAARAMTLNGDDRAFHAVLAGDPLTARLGPFALELFVLAGKPPHLRAMDRVASAMKTTPAILSAIGRFGHPRTFTFLTFALQDAALAEAAADALETLFGDIVPRKERTRPDAWSRAVAARKVDPDSRLRRGAPWSPAILAAEIQTGTLNRAAIAARADELRCRAGLSAILDLGAWGEDADASVGALVRMALSSDGGDLVCKALSSEEGAR
ncbi:MAG: hypothetical protein U0441_01095 [Polyangiaceae bacterium]